MDAEVGAQAGVEPAQLLHGQQLDSRRELGRVRASCSAALVVGPYRFASQSRNSGLMLRETQRA